MQLREAYITILFTILLSSFGGVGGGRLYAQTASAQTGTISGRLKEDDGMPAIGARLFVYTIDAMGDERIIGSANTADDNDNDGKYITEKIPIGIYTVNIKYPSYKRVIITGVPVEQNKSTIINLKLETQSPESSSEITIPYSSLIPKPVPTPMSPPADTSKGGDKKKRGKV